MFGLLSLFADIKTFFFSVIFCYVLFKVVKRILLVHKQFVLLKSMPGPPVKNRIVGNTKEFTISPEDIPRIALNLHDTYGGILKLWVLPILGFPMVQIAKAEYAEIFFTDKRLGFKGLSYDFLKVWLGSGLLTSGGQQWHERRKLITPAFHFSILKDFFDVFVKDGIALVEKLRERQDGTPVDVFEIIHLATLDSICESAMGIRIDALKNPQLDYVQALKDTAYTIIKRTRNPLYWNDRLFFLLPLGKKLRKDLNTLFDLTNKAISNGRKARSLKRENHKRDDEFGEKKKLVFLDLLLESAESNSVSLSDEDIRDEVNTFIFEGHDTTTAAISFSLYLLGLHPEIQEKCFQELNSIFEGSDRKPTVEDLHSMKYLEQVIKETLRLFPSVPTVGRLVKEDMKLGEFLIPEGTSLVTSIFALHRDPKVFPDPDRFDPDRFSAENCENRHPYAYVPFAAGSRNCIGQKYAMMEEKVFLSYILRFFSLESAYSMGDLKIMFSLVIRSQKSLDVRFIPRKTQDSKV